MIYRFSGFLLLLLLTSCKTTDPAKSGASDTTDKPFRNINEVVQRRLPIRSVTKGWKGNEISWPTENYLYYTVMYYDGLKQRMPKWTALPTGFNLKGTGDDISLLDKPRRGVNRHYRIEVHENPSDK